MPCVCGLAFPCTLLTDCLREVLPEEKTPFFAVGVVDSASGRS